MLHFTKSGQVLVRTFCGSRGPDLISIVVTLERVKANSSKAQTRIHDVAFHKERTDFGPDICDDGRDFRLARPPFRLKR